MSALGPAPAHLAEAPAPPNIGSDRIENVTDPWPRHQPASNSMTWGTRGRHLSTVGYAHEDFRSGS